MVIESDFFQQCAPLQIPKNAKHSKFVISYNPSSVQNCCKNLKVFEEASILEKGTDREVGITRKTNETSYWYRSKDFLKGFKDHFIGKISVCELW